MLVLARRLNQSVTVHTPLPSAVTVCEVRGEKVRLGFDGPAHYQVFRAALYRDVTDEVRAGRPAPRPRAGYGGTLVLAFRRGESAVVVDHAEMLALQEAARAGRDYEPVRLFTATVVDVRGPTVRLGFEAPEYQIDRAGEACGVHEAREAHEADGNRLDYRR